MNNAHITMQDYENKLCLYSTKVPFEDYEKNTDFFVKKLKKLRIKHPEYNIIVDVVVIRKPYTYDDLNQNISYSQLLEKRYEKIRKVKNIHKARGNKLLLKKAENILKEITSRRQHITLKVCRICHAFRWDI